MKPAWDKLMAEYKDSKERKLTAKEELFHAGKDLFAAKIQVSRTARLL